MVVMVFPRLADMFLKWVQMLRLRLCARYTHEAQGGESVGVGSLRQLSPATTLPEITSITLDELLK